MLIAARNAILAGGDLSAKSYVQDGLVAMWDGIENAGWGVHNAEATTWKDLVGNVHLDKSPRAVWTQNGIATVDRYAGGLASRANPFVDNDIATIEVCYDLTSDVGNNQGRGLACFSNTRSVMGAGLDSIRSRGAPSVQLPLITDQIRGAFSAAVLYGQSSSDDLIYFNGEIQSTESSGGNWGLQNYIRIGGASSYKSGVSVVGSCHSVRVYSRALTAAEVAANYAVDKARFNLT